jgi:acyl-CoA thioester hydrolase
MQSRQPGSADGTVLFTHTTSLRVRYSETDQMGTFYNSRALEWFECGRSELLRAMGLTYAQMEQRGLFLPLVEAHIEYRGRARYDDLLLVTSNLSLAGRARVKMDVQIVLGEREGEVARGWTVHVFTDASGRPVKPPSWFKEFLSVFASRSGDEAAT